MSYGRKVDRVRKSLKN